MLKLPTNDNPCAFPTPEEVKLALDVECVGNDHYKYALAHVFVEHLARNASQFANVEAFPRTNLLVTGPTGSGKSHLLKCLESIIDGAVPIIHIDCSILTPSGYKGASLEDLVINNWPWITKTKRVRKHPNNPNDLTTTEVQNTGILTPNDYESPAPIIFIDEIDKISMKLQHDSLWGINKQISLLKLLEGGYISSDANHSYDSTKTINTARSTVILAGCFDSVVKYNKIDTGASGMIGFNSPVSSQNHSATVTREELAEYGFMPELAGRISDVIKIDKIPKDQYLELLLKPDNGIFAKYKKLFLVYGAELRITGKTADEIVDAAYSSKLGVRSLSTELHNRLKPYMQKLKHTYGYPGVTIDV